MAEPIVEAVWRRIKATAERNAAHGIRLSLQESENTVNNIIWSEDGPFPDDAVQFYTRELIRLTDGYRAREPRF